MIFASARPATLVRLQLCLIFVGMMLVVIAPPAVGRMMLVPVDGTAIRRMIPLAVANGALLVAPGPMGSMIVVGDRARLIAALGARGIIVLAAPPAGCGAWETRA